jgi:hypothetical protein
MSLHELSSVLLLGWRRKTRREINTPTFARCPNAKGVARRFSALTNDLTLCAVPVRVRILPDVRTSQPLDHCDEWRSCPSVLAVGVGLKKCRVRSWKKMASPASAGATIIALELTPIVVAISAATCLRRCGAQSLGHHPGR